MQGFPVLRPLLMMPSATEAIAERMTDAVGDRSGMR